MIIQLPLPEVEFALIIPILYLTVSFAAVYMKTMPKQATIYILVMLLK